MKHSLLRKPFVIVFASLFVLAVFGQTPKTPDYSAPPGGGKRVIIKPDGLPKPFHTESVRNPPKVVPAPGNARLSVPTGFEVSVYAEGNNKDDYKSVRWVIEGPNGDVFLADSYAGTVYLLRDANKDSKIDNASERFAFATGLNRPFGMAIQKVGTQTYFYVGNTDSIVRYKYEVGQTKIADTPEKLLALPTGGHWTRNILFSKDGKKMYISVGSRSNVDAGEPEIRAAINEYNPDGTGHRIFAAGIRNPVGLAWNPANGELWTAVNERDLLGDDLAPEYATSVKAGAFYGWPYAYLGKNEDPRRKGEKPELVQKTIVPDVLIEPHSAALGIIFYTGNMFPKEYQGDAFVALHGSWNRKSRTGYKVIRIPFEKGKPEGGYEDFLSGWVPDPTGFDVWGRPVGLLMLRDGSLLVTDDGGNKVWRVTYKGKK